MCNLLQILRMDNSHKETLIKVNLLEYFDKPASPRQRQYEVIRAVVIDKIPIPKLAKRFGYRCSTIYSLLRDAKAGKLDPFPSVKKGPQERRTIESTQHKIIELRKQNLSTTDIYKKLAENKISISVRTIERILKDVGFEKLKRRSNLEMGITSKNKIIPEYSENINFDELKPFNFDCPVAGVFFFIPYIIKSGIVNIIKKCGLPESSIIGSIQACLSMLLLKLIGNERLSHIQRFDMEPGLAFFSGLNVLPKATYVCTYSCRTSEEKLYSFQEKIIKQFRQAYPELYNGKFINLDFHSIPHYGDESNMENVWCGSRGKTMKGANSVFAQDAENNLVLYTRSDILRKEEAMEIQKFIAYWKKIKGNIDETLVFDCKFTKYEELDKLAIKGIKFITLRKRSKGLIENTGTIKSENWKKVTVNIPKRKYQKVSIFEEKVILPGCIKTFRQITVKDNGRENPTYIITNNFDLKIEDVLLVYARRWRIENVLSEMVSFFNLNALSSPIMIRIHFDILWTMIADTLYHIFAQDLRRFEKSLSPTIFKKFIDMPGKVSFDGNKIQIKIRKRAHTPILMGNKKLQTAFNVPWLNDLPMEITWTA